MTQSVYKLLGMTWRILLPPIVIATFLFMLVVVEQYGFAGESISSMSIDEFNRNLWVTLGLAVLMSLAKGLGITVVVALVASIIAYVAVRDDRRWIRLFLRALCAVLESVPLVLWVVIVVVTLPGPRLWITLAAFGVLVLPSVTQIFLGEFTRLRTQPFVEAVRLLGLAEARIFMRYLLPAAVPVLVPMLIQVLGNAVAIDGAIGVFGLGSRSDIDLGVFLLRGKEQFVLRPEILLSALSVYALIYIYLQYLARLAGPVNLRAQRVND